MALLSIKLYIDYDDLLPKNCYNNYKLLEN
jgi:hypothetical protein